MSKKYYFIFILLFFIVCLGSCTSDISTALIKENGWTESGESKARGLLAEMEKAHGKELYKKKKTAEIYLSDTWAGGIVKMFAMPWQKSGEPLKLEYKISTNTSRIEFLEGRRKGELWGIQNWATYTKEPDDKEANFRKNKTIKFWLPTVQYFMEMPFVVGEAEKVAFAGTTELNGKTYDLVMASWKTLEPQKDIDQYLLWINQETKLLEIAQYTIRDMFNFMVGCMTYSDFKTENGITIGYRQTAADAPNDKKFMHQFNLNSVKFNTGISDDELYPCPALFHEK